MCAHVQTPPACTHTPVPSRYQRGRTPNAQDAHGKLKEKRLHQGMTRHDRVPTDTHCRHWTDRYAMHAVDGLHGLLTDTACHCTCQVAYPAPFPAVARAHGMRLALPAWDRSTVGQGRQPAQAPPAGIQHGVHWHVLRSAPALLCTYTQRCRCCSQLLAPQAAHRTAAS
jgi:hypothetical protein